MSSSEPKLVNLLHVDLTIYHEDPDTLDLSVRLKLPAIKEIAPSSSDDEGDSFDDRIAQHESHFGIDIYKDNKGLPEPKHNVFYIVCPNQAASAYHRNDLYYPGKYVHDDSGKIIGCVGLYKVTPRQINI